MNHTPGPWETKPTASLGPRYVVRPEADGPDIAIVYDHENTEANAKLIAASPDLLAACIAMRDKLSAIAKGWGGSWLGLHGASEVDAALEKAGINLQEMVA